MSLAMITASLTHYITELTHARLIGFNNEDSANKDDSVNKNDSVDEGGPAESAATAAAINEDTLSPAAHGRGVGRGAA